MRRPAVIWVDLDSPDEVQRSARSILESRFRVRDLGSGADLSNGSLRRPLERALCAEPDAERVVALVVCLPAPGPALRTLVQEVRRLCLELPILAVTGCREHRVLTDLLDSGVDDFSTHPDDEGDLLARLDRLAADVSPGRLPPRLREKVALRCLIGRSPSFVEVLRRLPLIAQADSPVLLTGETGTGKEVVSRAIHHLSARSSRPFVPVNCGALPLELVENELFGHERAAFTGADRARPGLVAEAEGGSLMLDEVDALPASAQVKLLRFLQEREYRPLGSPRARRADVRVIAATNGDVERSVAEGGLRPDLFYRLNVLPLHLPSLRERREDVLLLARHFLTQHARALDRPCPTLSPGASEALRQRDWPGNVRELSHLMERAVVMAGGRGVLSSADLLSGCPGASDRAAEERLSFREAKRRVVERFERQYLQDLLRVHRGNISRASEAAQKNRRAFWELLRKHHIDAARFREG